MEQVIGEIAQKMAELHDSPDHKAFRAVFTKSAQEPDLICKIEKITG
jgi:hypothetical protein